MNSLSKTIFGKKYTTTALSSPILKYDFNGNYNDSSGNANNGINSGNLSFVAGRKTGTQALQFASGTVVSKNVLPINSNKLGISFWIKTAQTVGACVYCTGVGFYNGDFGCFLNDQMASHLESSEGGENGYNIVNVPGVNANSWKHIVININRDANGNDSQTIYVDGIVSTRIVNSSTNNNNNFENKSIQIGGRNNAIFFNGFLQDFKLYNRNLSVTEINNLYNN